MAESFPLERPLFRVGLTTWYGKLPPLFVMADNAESAMLVVNVILADRAKDVTGSIVEGPLDLTGRL